MSQKTPKRKKKIKRVSKKTFEEHADFNCDRQLFLTLSIVAENTGKQSWRKNTDNIIPRVRNPTRAMLAAKIGTEYENTIYLMLGKLNKKLGKKDGINRVRGAIGDKGAGKTHLTPKLLRALGGKKLIEDHCLVEHEYPIPPKFRENYFGLEADNCRPDLIYVKPLETSLSLPDRKKIGILDNNGYPKFLNEKSLQGKIGLNVIDIKSVYDERVGINYFSELHYYLQTLNAFLIEYQLDDQYVILTEGNGILPRNDDILLTDLPDIFDEIVKLEFNATFSLYVQTLEKIQELGTDLPKDRNDIVLSFSPKCEKCNFLDDCLFQCGYDNRDRAKDTNLPKSRWDLSRATVDLLPNMPQATVAQLKDQDLKMISALAKKASTLQMSEYPIPMNKDIPMLKLTSTAIKKGDVEQADPFQLYSVAIPKYSRINVILTAEYDSTSERVFAFGVFVGISLNPKSNVKYKEKYRNWWQIWGKYLDDVKSYKKEHIIDIHQQLIDHVSPDIQESEVIQFAKGLHSFDKEDLGDKNSLEVFLEGKELPNGKTLSSIARIRMAHVHINNNLKIESELNFTKGVMTTLSHVIRMVMIMEQYIIEEQGINSAVYYWSQEIVEKVKALLEKHLLKLISDPVSRAQLDIISQWINPSDYVSDPNQIKKVFDLSKFVRTTFGLALPVNYAWHKVVTQFLNLVPRANRLYWSDLFNNMDRNQWHNFLLSIENGQMQEAMKKYKDIQSQVYSKIFRLYLLVVRFQIDRNIQNLISQSTWPERTRSSLRAILPRYYTLPAIIWYYFASLTETSGELTSRELRTMYPEFSIGKLEAGLISRIKRKDSPRLGREKKQRYIYHIELRGLSKNIKAKEGDFFFLIPEEMRDRINNSTKWTWQIQIRDISWKAEKNSLELTTHRTTLDLFLELRKIDRYSHIKGFAEITATNWYLFPSSSGNWADKLYNQRNPQNSLLSRNNLGISWLSDRFTFLNKIYHKSVLEKPKSMEFRSAEVYMFGPDIIQQIQDDKRTILLTDVYPQPDPSQSKSILHALEGKLSLVQGPPGTGKSKTIVAMIDEFLHRQRQANKQSSRILVTGFSYNSMNVILQNLPKSVNTTGKPTLAAQAQKLFVRSSYRENMSLSGDGVIYNVDNLVKTSSRWEFNDSEIKGKSERKLEFYLADNTIFFSNAHQLFHMAKQEKGAYIVSEELVQFDLIIIDEASQLPADHLLAILNHVIDEPINLEFANPPLDEENVEGYDVDKDNLLIANPSHLKTRVIIVGDNNQLPPVQPLKPPESLKVILGSSFDYYREGFKLKPYALKFNYRSHRLIVEFTESLGIYTGLEAAPKSEASDILLSGDINQIPTKWVKDILDPSKVLVSVVHKQLYDSGVSILEANIAVELIIGYFKMKSPSDTESQVQFWREEIGIVAPHNAQGRTIINMTFRRLIEEGLNLLSERELMNGLRNTIFSVEKFQGSERSMIIATIGVSANEQLRAEEEFIYDRNRLNVLTSRAKSKMILISSQNFLKYIPQDKDRFFDVWVCNHYTYEFCDQQRMLEIPFQDESYNLDFYFKSV